MFWSSKTKAVASLKNVGTTTFLRTRCRKAIHRYEGKKLNAHDQHNSLSSETEILKLEVQWVTRLPYLKLKTSIAYVAFRTDYTTQFTVRASRTLKLHLIYR